MPRFTRRSHLGRAAAALGGGIAAACSGLPGGTGPRKPLSGRVEFWANNGEGQKQERLVARFEERNPGIKVAMNTNAGGMDVLLAAAAAGSPPDVGAGFDSSVSVIGSKAVVEPLDDALKGTSWKAANLLEGMRTAHSFKGKVVASPYITDAIPLAINLDLMEKAGLKLPPKNWTWSDLAEFAGKLTIRSNEETKQWGLLCPPDGGTLGYPVFGQVLYSMGGTWTDAEGRKSAFASPQGITALEYWVDLVRRRRVSPLPWPTDWMVPGQDPRTVAFVRAGDGGVAMRPLQTFSISGVKAQATFRWQAVLPPQQPKLASPQGTGAWWLMKGASNKDNGVAFMLHLTDPEELALWAVDAIRLPTYKTVASHPTYQEFLKKTPELQVHWETALGSVPYTPPAVGWADGLPALRKAILESLQGIQTPSGALREAAAVMDNALVAAQSK